jgi:hypothetical protein
LFFNQTAKSFTTLAILRRQIGQSPVTPPHPKHNTHTNTGQSDGPIRRCQSNPSAHAPAHATPRRRARTESPRTLHAARGVSAVEDHGLHGPLPADGARAHHRRLVVSVVVVSGGQPTRGRVRRGCHEHAARARGEVARPPLAGASSAPRRQRSRCLGALAGTQQAINRLHHLEQSEGWARVRGGRGHNTHWRGVSWSSRGVCTARGCG